jgi:hypothetical protein
LNKFRSFPTFIAAYTNDCNKRRASSGKRTRTVVDALDDRCALVVVLAYTGVKQRVAAP